MANWFWSVSAVRLEETRQWRIVRVPGPRYSDSFLKIRSGSMRTASMIQRQNQGV